MKTATFDNGKPDAQLRSTYLVVAFGFGAVLFEGYDLVVYGSVVPALLAYKEWALTATQVGAIGSVSLLGMVIMGLDFLNGLAVASSVAAAVAMLASISLAHALSGTQISTFPIATAGSNASA